MTLCEYALEVAEEEAKKQLEETLANLTFAISDEIIATAEEIIESDKGQVIKKRSKLED